MSASPETTAPPTGAWRRAEHVAWRAVAGETVLVDLRSKAFYGLDPLAGYLWHLLDGRRTADDLVLCASEAGGDVERRSASISEFLVVLAARDLVAAGPSETEVEPIPLPEFPAESEFPPRLVWEEGLEAVAQPGRSCGFMPGQGDQCVGFPFQ